MACDIFVCHSGIITVRGYRGILKNQSHLAEPKRVLKRFIEVAVGGREEEEVVWSEGVLWGGGQYG